MPSLLAQLQAAARAAPAEELARALAPEPATPEPEPSAETAIEAAAEDFDYDRDLFGNRIDVFRGALERYGVWPTTVWNVDHSDQTMRRLKTLIGDIGVARPVEQPDMGGLQWMRMRQQGSGAGKDFTRLAARGGRAPFPNERANAGLPAWARNTRDGAVTVATDDLSVYCGKITASIFNPAIAAWLLNCFAPTTGTCFDPFAGGGTRAIMAVKHGLRYVGCELRMEEVEAVRARCAAHGVAIELHCVDARACDMIPSGSAEYLITCPPYWNLEMYDGGAQDLSMIPTYAAFIEALGAVVAQTARILVPGAPSCWVVGLHRDTDGQLTPMHHDLTRLHRAHGFRFREEIILAHRNNGAIQRIGNFSKGSHRLVRTHEYAMVYTR